jgi:hypothetical protein
VEEDGVSEVLLTGGRGGGRGGGRRGGAELR